MNLSPNFTKGTRPKVGYIIHGTLGKYEGAVDWLCTPPEKRPVVSYSSAHYVIAKDGRMTQLVQDSDVSWHCSNISNPTARAKGLLPSYLGKFLNPNESFVGIELEWFVGDTVTDAQYKAIIDIVKKGGLVSPVFMCHKEVTDYKVDFQKADGSINTGVVDEIMRRLSPVPVTDTITPLLSKLTSQIGAKDYKGAKDTTSFLFSELVKKI